MRNAIKAKLEFIRDNKVLFIGISVAAIILYVSNQSQSYLYHALPGMTEAHAYNINFKDSVVVDEILVQPGQLLNKGDLLFKLRRPDLQAKDYENGALLKEALVELNIYNDSWKTVEEWNSTLNKKLKDGVELTSQEMKFLSLYQTHKSIEREKGQMEVRSPFSGYAGEVFVKRGEAVSPFKTIVSIYQEKPTLVKSYIPESFNILDLKRNRESVIRSMTRSYQAEGKIVSIGTILTELPVRFQKDPTNKLYGREVTISLPSANQFYLGEKVFVTLGAK